jgi:hypothetical protein
MSRLSPEFLTLNDGIFRGSGDHRTCTAEAFRQLLAKRPAAVGVLGGAPDGRPLSPRVDGEAVDWHDARIP